MRVPERSEERDDAAMLAGRDTLNPYKVIVFCIFIVRSGLQAKERDPPNIELIMNNLKKAKITQRHDFISTKLFVISSRA